MNSLANFTAEEIQMKELIEKIVFDTIQDMASKTFADAPNGEVMVTKEKLAAIMGGGGSKSLRGWSYWHLSNDKSITPETFA